MTSLKPINQFSPETECGLTGLSIISKGKTEENANIHTHTLEQFTQTHVYSAP